MTDRRNLAGEPQLPHQAQRAGHCQSRCRRAKRPGPRSSSLARPEVLGRLPLPPAPPGSSARSAPAQNRR
jgi:hypothetical protein